DDLLLHFSVGDESRFFLAWSSHLNPASLSSAKGLLAEATDLELELRVHFAVHPQRSGLTVSPGIRLSSGDLDKLECEEAMLRFRTFLESRGSAMSESSPHLHYYALPYVSKLREHQTFGRIFNDEWLQTLRRRLENFIDDVLKLAESNAAKNKPSRLSYLYHCADIELNDIRMEMSVLERRLADALSQNSSSTRQLFRLEEEHQRLMSVTGELVSALESAIQGRAVDMANILGYCEREVPSLLAQINNRATLRSGSDSPDDLKAMDISIADDKIPVRLVAYELNYQLVKNELLRGDMDTKCRLIQALRWQLTKCGSPERRHSTLMAFISHDLLGCFKRQSEYATRLLHLLRSPSSRLQQGLCRLINAFASFSKGRAYLARNTQLIVVMVDALVQGQLDNTARDMIIASLQKLSLRRVLAVIMVDSGAMSWLLRTLPDDQGGIGGFCSSEGRRTALGAYGFEYATALFMNLCLSPRGRLECTKQPNVTLDVIMNLYNRNLPDILMYLNGALYSLIGDPTLLREARERTLEDKLREIQQNSSEELSHQIKCILEKLDGSASTEDAKDKDSGDEKSVSEEEESAVQGDEVEMEIDQGEAAPNEEAENGETLLWKMYTGQGGKTGIPHTSVGPRRSISTGSRGNGRRQTQTVNPMPHNGGERKSRSSGRKSSSPPELPAISSYVRKANIIARPNGGDRSPQNLVPSTPSADVLQVAPVARNAPTGSNVHISATGSTLALAQSDLGPEPVCLPEILSSPQALDSLQPETVFAARPKVPRTPENGRR
ncbi:lisH domain-containing protein ARMC9-like, partial [Tropilaelaps mercedesae]